MPGHEVVGRQLGRRPERDPFKLAALLVGEEPADRERQRDAEQQHGDHDGDHRRGQDPGAHLCIKAHATQCLGRADDPLPRVRGMASLLVVEDDERIGSLLESALRANGHDVTWQRTGGSALAAAGSRRTT